MDAGGSTVSTVRTLLVYHNSSSLQQQVQEMQASIPPTLELPGPCARHACVGVSRPTSACARKRCKPCQSCCNLSNLRVMKRLAETASLTQSRKRQQSTTACRAGRTRCFRRWPTRRATRPTTPRPTPPSTPPATRCALTPTTWPRPSPCASKARRAPGTLTHTRLGSCPPAVPPAPAKPCCCLLAAAAFPRACLWQGNAGSSRRRHMLPAVLCVTAPCLTASVCLYVRRLASGVHAPLKPLYPKIPNPKP
jgi:hypothetical protein